MALTEQSIPPPRRRVIEAVGLSGANSRAYLDALFAAYAEGRVVAVLPRGQAIRAIPGVKLIERRSFGDDPGWYEAAHEPIGSEAPAQISFTSGTTGRAKPLLLSQRALADVTERINAAMEVTGEIREYVGVPVTFSFGFGRVRAVAAAGGRAYLPPHGFDPAEIGRMLAAGEINAVSAVPTLWRVLLSDPSAIGMAARRRLKWIEIGSQYMARAEKEALKTLFRNARIVQHYGLTEASRSTLLDISATEGAALESVGRATGAVEVAVSEDGLIRVRGLHLAEGVVTGAGVKPLTDPDGWLTTADRGRLENGWLYYEGRADELINCGGIKIDPARFEQRLLARLGAGGGLAVARAPDQVRGERVLVAAETGSGIDPAALRAAAAETAAEDGLTAGVLAYREVAELPRTDTGKIRRAELPETAATAGAPEPDGPPAPEPAPEARAGARVPEAARARSENLQAIWAKALGVSQVPLDASFYDLGGDSLSALTVSLRMESLGLDPAAARGLFEGRSIAELAGLPPGAAAAPEPAPEAASSGDRAQVPEAARARDALPCAAVFVWSVNALRGLAALLVVFVHWSPGLIERLLPPAGAEVVLSALLPAFRFGTPGFAFLFGIGVGYFLLRGGRPAAADVVRRNRLTGLVLVGASLALIAACHLGRRLLEDVPFSGLELANALYNVLAYYLLAFLTLPFWIRALGRPGVTLIHVLGAALALWAVGLGVRGLVPAGQIDGLLEWPKLMLVAKYNYFKMTAIVFTGLALGLWLSRQDDPRRAANRLIGVGALVVAAMAIAIADAYPGGAWPLRPDDRFSDIAFTILYGGIATLALGAGIQLFDRWARQGAVLATALKLLVVAGVLALPIFALHQVVIPIGDILGLLGLPGPVALALPMAAFLAGMGLAGRHMYRLYFGPRWGGERAPSLAS